jgi:orotate phosphoribosyltransferase
MPSVLDLFKQTGALLHGHFILRSGLHSREFFQCALLLQDAPVAAQVCGQLAEKLRPFHTAVHGKFPTVVSPAVGGIIVGQEVARHLATRHIFVEKDGTGGLVMRRFEVTPGERFLIAEDVVTRGGRVQETIDIIRGLGGVVVAAGAIVNRSAGNLPDFGCPFVSLVQMAPETFPADALPPDLVAIPAVKPGSK